MSRGPGRVMRELLEQLEASGRPLAVEELSEAVNASKESTRRALRTLHHSQRVHFLGVHTDGAGRWCSPGNAPELSRLWVFLRKLRPLRR